MSLLSACLDLDSQRHQRRKHLFLLIMPRFVQHSHILCSQQTDAYVRLETSSCLLWDTANTVRHAVHRSSYNSLQLICLQLRKEETGDGWYVCYRHERYKLIPRFDLGHSAHRYHLWWKK